MQIAVVHLSFTLIFPHIRSLWGQTCLDFSGLGIPGQRLVRGGQHQVWLPAPELRPQLLRRSGPRDCGALLGPVLALE